MRFNAATRAAALGVAVVAATASSAVIDVTPSNAAASVSHGVRLNSYEARLLTDMNQVRHQHGLHPLVIAPDPTDVARLWSWHLARVQTLSHDPLLLGDLISHALQLTAIEENVGYGPITQPDRLFRAYMASPPHRANILSRRVSYVGIGAVERAGYAWNTIDFVNTYRRSYGPTRVPTDGIGPDLTTLHSTKDISSGRHHDQRWGARRAAPVSVSRVYFADGAVRLRLSSHHASGHGSLIFRDELSMRNVTELRFRIGVSDTTHSPVRVAVRLGSGWGSKLLRVIRVGKSRTVTVKLPRSLRTSHNAIRFSISGRSIRQVHRRLTLAVSRLTAVVS